MLVRFVARRSGEGIAYSTVDVKNWEESPPSAQQARPACCSQCGAASRPPGGALVLVSHGLRERQVRGPAGATGAPETRVLLVRRYRCRRCKGITTVLPRGLVARRHYSASAIGLALCLYGLQMLTLEETRKRVCTWQACFEPKRWTTLRGWATAIDQGRLFPMVRPMPAGSSLRERASRAASTLCAFAVAGGSLAAQVFEGAARAA